MRFAVTTRGEVSGRGIGGSGFGFTAATSLAVLQFADRLITLQLTFGSRADSRFLAIPTTRGFFTNRRAVGFRGFTNGVTTCRGTDGLTFRTRRGRISGEGTLQRIVTAGGSNFEGFTTRQRLRRASYGAFRLFAVHFALRARQLSAFHLTTRALTDGMADRRAARIIALPAAGRMAHFLFARLTITRVARDTCTGVSARSSHGAFA